MGAGARTLLPPPPPIKDLDTESGITTDIELRRRRPGAGKTESPSPAFARAARSSLLLRLIEAATSSERERERAGRTSMSSNRLENTDAGAFSASRGEPPAAGPRIFVYSHAPNLASSLESRPAYASTSVLEYRTHS